MKTIIVGLLLLLFPIPALSDSATQPSKRAAERAELLKANTKTFKLSLDYKGPQPKDKPYLSLTLSVPDLHLNDIQLAAPFRASQISVEQAKAIIDHLTADGFLDHALDGNRNPGPVPPREPYYSLVVQVVDVDGNPVMFEQWLGWDLKMLQRLDGLRKVLVGDAGKEMDILLQRMSDHRKEWQDAGAATQPGNDRR